MAFMVEVNLSHSQLSDIPVQLSECKSLQSLDMSHNSLTSVSCDLSSFPRLATLDLSHNMLSSLPTIYQPVPGAHAVLPVLVSQPALLLASYYSQ